MVAGRVSLGEILIVDEQKTRISHQHFGVVCGELSKKILLIERRREKRSEVTMDVGRGSAQGGDLRLNEAVTLREIANEAREKVMYERIERIEKQMETLTTILHELRNKRNGVQEEGVRSGGMTPGHVDRMNNDNMMRGRATRRFGGEMGNSSLRGENYGG